MSVRKAVLAASMAMIALSGGQALAQKKYYARQSVAPRAQAAVTYSWQSDAVDTGCSVNYGRHMLVSTAVCMGSDGSTVPDARCASAKPASGETTFGEACTSTVDCSRQSYSNRSGIQSESYVSFTAASLSEGVLQCGRISNANHRIGTCTFVGGTSWRIYTRTNGTQSAQGQTSWPCQPGSGSVP